MQRQRVTLSARWKKNLEIHVLRVRVKYEHSQNETTPPEPCLLVKILHQIYYKCQVVKAEWKLCGIKEFGFPLICSHWQFWKIKIVPATQDVIWQMVLFTHHWCSLFISSLMEDESNWIHDVALTSINSHYNSEDISSNYSILSLEKRIWSQMQHTKNICMLLNHITEFSWDYASNA